MRYRLMAAAAMAPLFFVCSQPAHAQTTVSSNSGTQYNTAATGDLTINSGVTIQPSAGGPIVTLNSNNIVANQGALATKNYDNVTGIQVNGPFTGAVTNGGSISISEDYAPSDSANADGVTEAPYAQGTNRFGIRVVGPLAGNIQNSGSIYVQGNDSVGLSVESRLAGSIADLGTISVVGDRTVGLRNTAEITGGVQVSNGISAKGLNTVGLQVAAPIDGQLTVYSSITSTGYAVTTRVTGTTALANIQKTPADVQQGGSALLIQSSVLGGVFLGAPPVGTVSTDSTTDADGDGIVDSVEGTAAISTFGSAPALQIGGSSPITIGAFNATGYGLLIRGNIVAQGVFDGVPATAVDIGAGGGGVSIAGGVYVYGTVSAQSYQANATAFHIESGTATPLIVNAGSITANVTSASANLASGLIIDAGAKIGGLINYGTISGVTTGDAASASAVVDRSGTVSNVLNQGYISATLQPTLAGEVITGRGIALDLSANTTGVTFNQTANGTVTPYIIGDVLLGSGKNTVNLLSGSITGALSLGSGAGSSLTIDNGASYVGALTYGGSSLAINIANGTLTDKSATTIGASSLTVGAASTLTVALDPVNNTSSLFNVSGAATLAPGAKIGAVLLSTPTQTGQTFNIVRAGTLSVGSPDSALLASLPYLFAGSVHADTAAKTIAVTVRTKSPAELGFNTSETAAFNAIYAALPKDTGIQTAIVSASTRDALVASYDQLLPNSSGDVFETARGMSKSVSRAAADRFDLPKPLDEDEEDFNPSGFWASEFFSGVEQYKADNNAYHSAALGVIGGYDFGGTGVTISAASSNITRPNSVGDSLNSVSVVEAGAYIAPKWGPLTIDARVGAGYLKATNRRQLVVSVVSGDLSTTSTVTRTADGDWSGYDLSAHLGAAYQLDVTKRLFFQPKVYADVFHLHEDAYNEKNGGVGYDFNVSQRSGTQTNATASVITGMKFGNNFILSPTLELGYDKVVTGGAGITTARFAYGGPTFSVAPNQMDGAGVARLTLRGDGNYVHFALQAGGEYNTSYRNLDLKAIFRMTF